MASLGLYPGLVFYLTFWYRPEERSLRIAIFLASASLAGAFGGSIAYAVGHMNGVAGLVAWRWLFILEGIPSCLSAIVIVLFLPNYPESADWLNAEEKALAADRMRSCGSKGGDETMTWNDLKKTLMEWRLYAHYLVIPARMTVGNMSQFAKQNLVEAILPHLSAFFQPVPFHSCHSLRPWVYISQCPAHDHPALCSCVCRNLTGLLVRRSLRLVSVRSFSGSVSMLLWLTCHLSSRALHAAACAIVATVGFIGLATLPPDAYLVG